MNSSWKWKAYLSFISTALAIWFVLPNFVDVPAEKDETKDTRAWYEKILPSSKLHLGLDLQGGIHMVLGVDLKRAMLNESDRYIQDLKNQMQQKQVEFESIHRDFDATQIQIQLKNKDQSKAFTDELQKTFSNLSILEEDKGAGKYVVDLLPERRADVEKQTIEQALNTLRKRLDEFGVAEPSIQARGNDQIIIQLPGLDDPQKAKRIVGRTAQLEFKLVDSESLPKVRIESMFQEAKSKLPKEFTMEQLNQQIKAQLPPGTLLYYGEERDPTTGEAIQTPYLLKTETMLTGDMLEDARISVDEFNRPTVNMSFNPQGAQIFEKATEENVGKMMAIVLDDKVQSAPQIREKIGGGHARISLSEFKPRAEVLEEAKELSMVLRAGALPAPVEILQNSAVGPSLGRDSIERGMKAMMIGVLLVVFFMAIYYRVSGVMADVAVLVNVLFTFACLGALNATLTLPGIAGIIISVGMAVDANVIIYERIREELKLGKNPKAAVEAGYDRAHLTIIDSNLTTIITALVLLEYGTGPIKGFAITLIFGLIANYFTALWFTRLFYDWIIAKFNPARLSI